MPIHALDPYAVGRIQSLGMTDDSAAKAMLQKVAHQVQPIMKNRKFTVPLLKEMFPAQRNLLAS